ncbi:Aste57867_15960 [Aphanomyces stellatus]|uniref:Aste57867_15960 protein n=1 Tax=Aphanomyces stellatus TaxID=120398 RepID=A0A485L4W6_9STRA|nr:hypothetical protein As57867_015904 [Aphanomyces stellatus]VFT92745.1 Aste57867_15960 [Aphanomyces stellatus]
MDKELQVSGSAMNGGRWTEQEHESFLAGLHLYGREWKKVAAKIKTRTSAQIRSHAQKYFAKLAKDGTTDHPLSDDGSSTSTLSDSESEPPALPSPEEILRTVPERRLSDAEVCALQVLAWYDSKRKRSVESN